MVAMLPQAGCPGQKRGFSYPFSIRSHRQHDAVIWLAVTVPIAVLEKPGKGIELAPGLGRLELEPRLASRLRGCPRSRKHRADRPAPAPIRRTAVRTGRLRNGSLARGRQGRNPCTERRPLPDRRAASGFTIGRFARFGIRRPGRHDRLVRNDRQRTGINQVAESLPRKDQDVRRQAATAPRRVAQPWRSRRHAMLPTRHARGKRR